MTSLLDPRLAAACSAVGFRTKRPVEGPVAGQHRSPLQGLSPEFVDYRDYTPGDDPKTLDWKAHARSDRFYIKRFEEESNLRAMLVVDDSASMAYRPPARPDDPTKFQTAGRVAAALASALLSQRDAVGLMTASDHATLELRPSAAGQQLARLVETLEGRDCAGGTDLLAAIEEAAERVPRRSVLVVISDFLTDLDGLERALGRCRHKGHELVAVQVLDRDEVELSFEGSVVFRDIEGDGELTAEPWAFRESYAEAMAAFRADLAGRVRAAGYALWPVLTDEDLAKLLPRYLSERR